MSKIAVGLNVTLSTLFENLGGTAASERSYAGEVYDLIQALPICFTKEGTRHFEGNFKAEIKRSRLFKSSRVKTLSCFH